jgi:hypothetical protein
MLDDHIKEVAPKQVSQPDGVELDFVNPASSAAFLFSALRFFVTVLSDLNGFTCALKALFSRFRRRS